ncbi:hypothetical protein QOT17_010386 [Balamuthia mandrillaris]
MNENKKQEHKACAPCREAHQACDKGRPCGRCRHLDRTHLCRDPLPPLRKRGRPPKPKNQDSNTSPSGKYTPPPLHARIFPPPRPHAHLFPTTGIPFAHSSPAIPHYAPPPSSFASAQRTQASSTPFPNVPSSSFVPPSFSLVEDQTRQQRLFSSPSSSPEFVSEETEEASPAQLLPAQFCHRCGVEFVLQEAVFCMSCGLKRALFHRYGSANDPNGSPTKKRKHDAVTTATAASTQSYNNNHNNVNNSKHVKGAESEDSPPSQPTTSSPSSSSPSSSSPCFSSSPLSFTSSELDIFDHPFTTISSSSPSPTSSKNGTFKLWLPPMAANTRKPSIASIPYFSKAHLLECYVDNELTEPWALMRPFALDAEGGSIVAVNSAFLKTYGYSQNELLGRCFRLLVPEELFEIMELMYERMMTQLGVVSNCQVLSHDTCPMTTKDGTWLMSHSLCRCYYGPDGGLMCIAVQMKSAVPVQRGVAVEWAKHASIESWKVAPQTAVALPKDVRFHEGTFFPAAPLSSLVMKEGAPVDVNTVHSSAIQPYSSSAMQHPTSPSFFSTVDFSSTTYLDLLTSPAFDGGGSSCWSDGSSHVSPSSSSASSSVDRFSLLDESLCEPSPTNTRRNSFSYPL